MRIDAPDADAVRSVARNMRARDLDEIMAVSHAETRADLIDALVARYADAPDAYCFGDDQGWIAIGAMAAHRPNVITLGFFATDRFPALALPIARFARRELFPAYRARGVHRIDCVSKADYPAAHKWITLLGLRRAPHTLRGFGRDGQDFLQFEWVRDDLAG